ncbi:MAG: protein tyrosine phosphatase family protein [Gammaproteobacteria bacterium]|nr:protein tyrosine phosphatase family protein [Gammaproteobacteria bacterium]MCP5202244.1 protein tyrosine phosphatase family protein [Gammaproteobacteria bacterium]
MRRFALSALLLLCNALIPASAAEEVGLIELLNYYEYSPQLMSAGQPTREQFPAVAAAGVAAVVNLAPLGTPGAFAEEGEVVTGLGMDYAHIPVDWEHPAQTDLADFFRAMRHFAGRRVLVHCNANARASAFVYLWRTLERGEDEAPARATMVEIWDWNPGYELANMPQWQQFVSDARAAAAERAAVPR